MTDSRSSVNITKWAAVPFMTAHSARVSAGMTRSAGVPGQRPIAVSGPGGHLDSLHESSDEQTGHVLECSQVSARTVVGLRDPSCLQQTRRRLGQLGDIQILCVELSRQGHDRCHLGP
jgi:hypothetical protein